MTTSARRVLLVGGSLNQTSMMCAIGRCLNDCETAFSPFYADGLLRVLASAGLLDFTILAGQAREKSLAYVREHGFRVDERGERGGYDLILAGTDLVVPVNARQTPLVVVQEGMTDPEDWRYHLVRRLGLPRFLGNTSMTGLSGAYARFCVASEGYRDLFIRKGAPADRLVVTGIPNFDDVRISRDNSFPHKGYVLAATSCLRETLKREDRRGFIRKAVRIADGRPLLFKLHPNENWRRATREIERDAKGALVFSEANTAHMVANCDVFVTKYSSVVFLAVALGKEVHSEIPRETLERLMPIQNGGDSARRIAAVCREVMAA